MIDEIKGALVVVVALVGLVSVAALVTALMGYSYCEREGARSWQSGPCDTSIPEQTLGESNQPSEEMTPPSSPSPSSTATPSSSQSPLPQATREVVQEFREEVIARTDSKWTQDGAEEEKWLTYVCPSTLTVLSEWLEENGYPLITTKAEAESRIPSYFNKVIESVAVHIAISQGAPGKQGEYKSVILTNCP